MKDFGLQPPDRILQDFRGIFSRWSFCIPVDRAKSRSPGYIQENGWLIQYCFGKDVAGEYLDYYATHRLGGDSHRRLRDDGTNIRLSALRYFYPTSYAAIEDKRPIRELYKHNCTITNELAAKGFNLYTVNMAICSGRTDVRTPNNGSG